MPRRKPIPTILGDINCGSATNTKMFGKKLVLLDPSNASCWMFSNIEDAAEKISQHCCLVIFLANDSNFNLPS